MKKLKIKGNNINNLFIAMNIFNLHELVKIEYSYDNENKKPCAFLKIIFALVLSLPA